MKTKTVLLLLLVFVAIRCEISQSQLPCIFGKWTIVQMKNSNGTSIDTFKLHDNLLLSSQITVNFEKSNVAEFSFPDSTKQRIKFKFDEKGISFDPASESTLVKELKVEKDTMLWTLNGNNVRLER